MSIQLYQSPICLQGSRIRALLDFKGLSYEKIEVSPFSNKNPEDAVTESQLPLLVDSEIRITEENFIIRYIEKRYPSKDYSLIRPGKQGDRDLRSWLWIDEKFLPLVEIFLFGRWTLSLCHYGMIQKSRSLPRTQRWLFKWMGASTYWTSARRQMRHLKIKNFAEARHRLENLILEWEIELGGNPYMAGPTPRIADILLYGVVRELQLIPMFRHQVTAAMDAWFERMAAVVEQHCLGIELSQKPFGSGLPTLPLKIEPPAQKSLTGKSE